MSDAPTPSTRAQAPEQDIVRANVTRKVTQAPTFGSYYANDTQIQTTPWDVRFRFGQVVEVDPANQTATVEAVADVRMSPEHAKRLVTILQQQLTTFEARFGTIPQPPED